MACLTRCTRTSSVPGHFAALEQSGSNGLAQAGQPLPSNASSTSSNEFDLKPRHSSAAVSAITGGQAAAGPLAHQTKNCFASSQSSAFSAPGGNSQQVVPAIGAHSGPHMPSSFLPGEPHGYYANGAGGPATSTASPFLSSSGYSSFLASSFLSSSLLSSYPQLYNGALSTSLVHPQLYAGQLEPPSSERVSVDDASNTPRTSPTPERERRDRDRERERDDGENSNSDTSSNTRNASGAQSDSALWRPY